MKKKIIIPLLFLGIILGACSPVTPTAATEVTPPIQEPTALPGALSTTQTGYLNLIFGIHFSYPTTWYFQKLPSSIEILGISTQATAISLTSFDPANPPHKLEWTDQTVSIQFQALLTAMPPASFDDWVNGNKQAALNGGLEVSAEERFQIAGQPAERLTLVSGSGGIIQQVFTILDERPYVINVEGNYDLAKGVLASIQPVTRGGMQPPDSETPAAGICGEPQGDIVPIILGSNASGLPLGGRCVVVNTNQRIKFTNQSNGSIEIKFTGFNINLPAGEEIFLDSQVGEYLGAGVHFLPMGPELWVKQAGPTATATLPAP